MKWIFAIERFEGPWAMLETEDGEIFEFPRVFLPPDCSEGAYVSMEILRDTDAEKTARQAMKEIRDSLKS